MKIIGLTGGIGSGKTTVARLFEKRNIAVYYADSRAKSLMSENKTLRQQIKILLGRKAYFDNGKLNRKWIASRVFGDLSVLSKMNNIVHPAVEKDFYQWINFQKPPYVLKEAAILIESGHYKLCDKIILVTAQWEKRVERIQSRDKTPLSLISAKMKSQISDDQRLKYADYLIENDTTVTDLDKKVKVIHDKILMLR